MPKKTEKVKPRAQESTKSNPSQAKCPRSPRNSYQSALAANPQARTSAVTVENLEAHSAAFKDDSAATAYELYLQQGRVTLDKLHESAYAQQWEYITNRTHAVAKDDTAEDLLECFGVLSDDSIDINVVAQPASYATPMERFLAEISSGINRRLLDRSS